MFALRCPGAVIESVVGLAAAIVAVERILTLACGINHKGKMAQRVARIPNGILMEG